MTKNETIAAISTPLGEGGIGIVRLSGQNAFAIVDRIFDCPKKKQSGYPRPRYLYHGFIKDLEETLIDEVLVSFMPAPHTYTREDIVEINCHSGIFTLRSIEKLVLQAGACLAEPGEFTKRAFVNGRLDLSQAEAVLNMVHARSEEAVKMAARGLQGELAKKVESIRDKILTIRAPIEASFDYPEEFDPNDYDKVELKKNLGALKTDLQKLVLGVERNRAYQDGVSVAIIGKPNVGKSSLLNSMLHKQRAIVHEIPGTTRDLLEGYMNLGGYPIRLVDTAGIQGTCDPVEKQGIELSRSAAGRARLIIMVVDGSVEWSETDKEIAGLKHSDQGLVIAINKSDLEQKLNRELVKNYCPDAKIVETSAVTGEGIKQLENAVTNMLDNIFGSDTDQENQAIVSMRHERIIDEALMNVESAIEAIDIQPLEIISLELQNAWLRMGEITGDTVDDDLLDKIFSEFCLGK